MGKNRMKLTCAYLTSCSGTCMMMPSVVRLVLLFLVLLQAWACRTIVPWVHTTWRRWRWFCSATCSTCTCWVRSSSCCCGRATFTTMCGYDVVWPLLRQDKSQAQTHHVLGDEKQALALAAFASVLIAGCGTAWTTIWRLFCTVNAHLRCYPGGDAESALLMCGVVFSCCRPYGVWRLECEQPAAAHVQVGKFLGFEDCKDAVLCSVCGSFLHHKGAALSIRGNKMVRGSPCIERRMLCCFSSGRQWACSVFMMELFLVQGGSLHKAAKTAVCC